ncbi:nitronate monooxygenase [Variovorax guangxiensis]|uniref:NAD(P)H-dependent flavin oxidoreductase n=1 Tax=Variovorax guangxiensis TaxID=1775474 RepID=UPI002854254D|nr:nitronate monooxygenase [Variovorax guangxiensis]MDR6861223.1 nitronate monooxygenase [Variovorax guangxiensis]
MIPPQLQRALRLPMLAAPMFLVSNPNFVVASCRAGIVGTFPSLNQRTSEGYEDWLKQIRSRLGGTVSFGVQFPIHRTNPRVEKDLAVTVEHKVPLLITSMGITREITDAVHSYGGLVFHDAISVRHARKALDANVDGIIAVCGGAGGHAGTYNPFAFLAELRPLVGPDRTLLLGGCIGDGYSMAGAIAAGADLVYVGTRMAATLESGAQEAHKKLIVDSDITDIVYSDDVAGVGGNWLKSTIPQTAIEAGTLALMDDVKRWRDIWSAGQGVGSIHDTPTVAELVERMAGEFEQAADILQRPNIKSRR